VFAAVVEEAVVVGAVLEGCYFGRDEGVQVCEVGLEVWGDGEIHAVLWDWGVVVNWWW